MESSHRSKPGLSMQRAFVSRLSVVLLLGVFFSILILTGCQSSPSTTTTPPPPASKPAFVQINANDPQGTPAPGGATSVQVTYTNAQTAGDLNIVAIGWGDTVNAIIAVSDSAGNTYNLAVSQADNNVTQAIYYASNIRAAAAGANTVTVTFTDVQAPWLGRTYGVPVPDVRIVEYSGVSTLDQVATATGTADTLSSGNVATTSASELLFGANYVEGNTYSPGSGYTSRMVTWANDIVEDQVVSASGTYAATATGSPYPWIMQLATFAPSGTLTAGILVSPATATVNGGATQPFTATVTGLSSTAVTWSVNGGGGTITSAGVYTAPMVTGSTTDTVTATSQVDPNYSGSASVTVNSVTVNNGTTVNPPPQATYYASPTGSGTACTLASPCSLTQAQTSVEAVNTNMTGNIIVYLEGGTYNLSTNPLALTNADSGNNGYYVIYEAMPGQTPVFEGGYSVPASAWTLHDSSLNIYAAAVPSTLEARQIYVNGQRAIRARSPNLTDPVTMGPYYMGQAPYPFQVPASEVGNLATAPNLNQLGAPEMVYVANFMAQSGRIASITTSGSTATVNFMPSDAYMSANTSWCDQGPTTPFYFENAYQLLDAPGEWFLDLNAHVLYYIPLIDQSMTGITVMVPVAQSVVTITGTSASSPAQNILLSGITFQDTNWTFPDYYGYFDWQSGEQGLNYENGNIGGEEQPGAVWVANAQNITLQNNTFQHTGAQGLLIQVSNNVQVLNNIFTDLSTGGVYIDGAALVPTSTAVDTNDMVSNNLVDHFGQAYSDGGGIFTNEAQANNTIQHNEIRYGGYVGIEAALWSGNWGAAGMDYMINDSYQYNRIHDVMQIHDDGAGIYTAGVTPGMLIQNNYIYSIVPSAVASISFIGGIYLDADAGGKIVLNNVLDNVNLAFNGCPNLYGDPAGGHDTITGNYYNEFVNAYGCISSGDFINNVYVNGEDWPPAAQAIISGAGIEPGAAVGAEFKQITDVPSLK